MIISFAWTASALVTKHKQRTRRYWKTSHALKFHTADIVDAYDKSPQWGGKKVGEIELLHDPYKQRTSYLLPEDYVMEGFSWMCKHGIKIQNKDPRVFFSEWAQKDELVYVVTFKLVSLTDAGEDLREAIERTLYGG